MYNLAKSLYPEASKECSEFMRHKTFLFYPGLILGKNIKVNKCLQNPGEFVITLARSYHAGFNMGFNCAEAVNFATKSWVNTGMKAKSCDCQSGSVKVDMNYFMRNLMNKKKLLKKDSVLKVKKYSNNKNKLNKSKISENRQLKIIKEKDEATNMNKNLFLGKKRKLKEALINKPKKNNISKNK